VDRIEKELEKFTSKEREWVREILTSLRSGAIEGLQIKKLKGREDIFRVRKGKIRILYRVADNGAIFILTIERRRERTYRK